MNSAPAQIEILLSALKLTLSPSPTGFQKAEELLNLARQENTFFSALLAIIDKKDLEPALRLAACCCLAKDLQQFLGVGATKPEPALIMQVLNDCMSNIFRVMTENFDHVPIRNKLEECLKHLIRRTYPECWSNLTDLLLPVLKDSSNLREIYCAARGLQILFSKYKNMNDVERAPLSLIVQATLPYVENLAMKLINQMKDLSKIDMVNRNIMIMTLNVVVKSFKNINHLQIETGTHFQISYL